MEPMSSHATSVLDMHGYHTATYASDSGKFQMNMHPATGDKLK